MPAILSLLLTLLAGQAGGERIADIQIHGNVLTPEADVRRIAAVELGQPIDDETIEQIASRLRDSHRFQKVEVLKRFASIEDATKIALVIVVDEGPVTIGWDDEQKTTRVRRSRGPRLMYWPIFDREDGYGFTYGLRTTIPDPAGKGSRLSLPLTWGGEKRAAAEFSRDLDFGVDRIEAGGSISRRTHPYFDANDDRRRASVRVEKDLPARVRLGASSALEWTSLIGENLRASRAAVDAQIDTRLDPWLARNAFFGRVVWDLFDFDRASSARQLDMEAAGYIGLIGQSIVELRVHRVASNTSLPAPYRPLLGGADSVRGFKVGSAIGDTLATGSAELRVPLTSPLSVGKIGLSAFADFGTVYDKSESIQKQKFAQGLGGGIWFSAALFRLQVDVAHGIGASTRVHAGANVIF